MATHIIGGVKVEFPCKPYPSQISMMYKIICGLERKQNCLLESPTGSGKSLALLCAALAWQSAQREKRQAEEKEAKSEVECCCQCKTSSKYFDQGQPTADAGQPITPGSSLAMANIQSDGVVVLDDDDDADDFKPSSLQKTPQPGRPHVSPAYEESAPGSPFVGAKASDSPCCNCQQQTSKKKVKIPKIYFGTRTHKQIAQIAKELGRTSYKHVNMCILGSREHTCVDPQVSRCSNKNEECKLKLEGPGCRFFDNVRKISHRGLKNLGLYEAWDLEDFVDFCKKQRACPYFSARQLKEGADIIFCPYNYLIDPVVRKSMEINLNSEIVILDEAHNIEDTAREAGSFKVSKLQLREGLDDLQSLVRDNVNPVEHGVMIDLLLGIHETIENNEKLVGGGNYDNASKVLHGLEIVAQLSACRVGPEDCQRYLKAFNKVMSDDADKRYEVVRKMKGTTVQVVDGLLTVLDFLYRNNMMFINDYRVALIRTLSSVKTVPTGGWLNKRAVRDRKEWTYTLNFWCMNPAVAFSDVSSVVRSIVLTSGTLSPMDSFASELGVPFEIQLEAAHVVGKSQVWVGTISKGPRGGMLLGSYQHSETFAYQDELGQLLLHVCETVPHGVLCFLSSYKMMEKLANRWRDTGLWGHLETLKTVMVEPKASDKEDFDLLMKRFYDVIRESENQDKENEETGVTGALFLAVCRGKVSEGLDFANNNARAVVAVGIPFPNVKDTQVTLKKEYNNQHCGTKGLLSGGEWYEIQAYRALNQALGRCIRHKQDWGALILVDERYAKNPKRYTKGLSKWVRQRIQYYGYFNEAHSSLKEYTQKMLENPPADQSNISMFDTTMNETVIDRTPLLQKPEFCNNPGSSGAEAATLQTSMTEHFPQQPVTPARNEPSAAQNAVTPIQGGTNPAKPTFVNVGGKLILVSPPPAPANKPATPSADATNKTLLVPINNSSGPPVFVPVKLDGVNPATTQQPAKVPAVPPAPPALPTPPAPNSNRNGTLVLLPDGRKVILTPVTSFLPMAGGKSAAVPQPTTPKAVAPLPSNQGISPSPLFNSQAGGFLSSTQMSTQNSQVNVTQKDSRLNTTVVKGSLGSVQKQEEKVIDFPDDLDLEFNPTFASTQRTPVTINRAGQSAKKITDHSTPFSSKILAAKKMYENTLSKPQNDEVKPVIIAPDSPPLFDSEEPDSGPMDINEEPVKSDNHVTVKKECAITPKKVSVATGSCAVKSEPVENVKDEYKTSEVRVSSRGRQIKPTLKSLAVKTDTIKGEGKEDTTDKEWTEQEDVKPAAHNRSLSRRRLSRRNRSGVDQDLYHSVNKGAGKEDVKDTNAVDEGENKQEEKPKEAENNRSGGKRRRKTVTPTSGGAMGRKKAKGVEFDNEQDDKVTAVKCEACGNSLLNDGADFCEKEVPAFLKSVTKEGLCFLSDVDALSDSCDVVTENKSGLALNCHWCEDGGCFVQYLQCRGCQCWENDKGHVIGAKVVNVTPGGGHFRTGQVWLSKESISTS